MTAKAFKPDVIELPRDHPIDQLGHAGAPRSGRDDVSDLLDGGQCVRHRDGEAARAQEDLIVSASPTPIVRRGLMPSAASAGARPVALVTSAGNAITDPLLKMMCHSSPRSWMAASTWCSNGSTVATIEWPIDAGTPACLIRSINARRRRRGDEFGSLRGRLVDDRAVLGHDALEDRRVREHAEEIPQLAPGDHDQPETGGAGAVEGVERWLIDDAVVGDGPVVVGCQRRKFHRRPGQPSTLSAARTPRTIASAITSAASAPSTVSAISGR